MIVMMPHLTAAGTKYIIIICYRCWSCPRTDLEIMVFRVDRQRFLKRASFMLVCTPDPHTIDHPLSQLQALSETQSVICSTTLVCIYFYL